ncbi:variant erythrocyte surface antigen-1, alpha subunit, partial [Babesia divergens]
MVCCMYYTDVFVGTDNINNLKKALNAELKDFDDSNDLTQLVHGLCLFMGYPSCLCSLKVNVNESLKDISRKLKKDFKAVQSCVSILNFDLNCNSCNSKDILCKCCVIQCIKEVKKCGCLKSGGNKQKCHCDGQKVSCAKVLSGLEACLHLQCLQSDMEDICKCNDPEKCCKSGKCIQASGGSGGSCEFCQNLNAGKSVPTTGLGLSPPNPIRLAKRLEKFFGNGQPKNSCGCKGSPCTCCCLACESNKCSEACSCNTSGCSCDKVPKKPSECPRKKFCSKINSIKIAAESTERTCCKGGTECHCKVDGSGSKCNSGQCCVVSDSKGSQQGVKCMIRRLVRFFTSFDPSKPDCPKLCCEIFCVLKCCDFLKTFYGKGKKDVCWTCKSGGTKGKCKGSTLTSGKGGPCCGGNPSKCSKSNCCQGCQDCDAIKFRKALQTLQYSGPCGQELYRLLDGLLNFCSNVFWPYVDKKEVKEKIEEAKKKCDKCSQKTSGTPCTCSDCDGCKALRGHNDIMSILRHGYVSSYTYKFESYFDPPAKGTYASWNSLCPSGSKCCSNPSCSCPSSCSSSNPSSCDPSQCCPDCPQRKAAKIFLGFLPCLYYGLKILHARCKYGSGFAGWHDITMDSKGLPSSGLAKFFFAWGYGLRPL